MEIARRDLQVIRKTLPPFCVVFSFSLPFCLSHTYTLLHYTILETGRPEVLFLADLVAMEESLCDCGSLYESVLHRFIYLDIWFPTGIAIWGTFRRYGLTRGSMSPGTGFESFRPCPICSLLSLSTLCLCLRYDPSVCCSIACCHASLPGSTPTLLNHKPK